MLNGTHRKNGYTQHCADIFSTGMSSAGAQVESVELFSENIKPCLGCFHCWSVNPGVCIQNDSMKSVINSFLDSELVVFVSPLYAYTISSSLKIFMERTLQLIAPIITITSSGRDRNSFRFPNKGPKIAAALIVAGLRHPTIAKPAIETIRLYTEGFGIDFAGAVFRNESSLMQFTDTKPSIIKSIETAIFQAGVEIIQYRKFSEITLEKISQPLVPDSKTFSLYSSIYWEYGQNFSFHKGNFDKIKYATNRDIRLLMNEMTYGFDAATAADLEATISYQFTNPDYQFTHSITGGRCSIDPVFVASAHCRIICETEVWIKIILNEADPLELMSKGLLNIQGDQTLFRKIGRIFKARIS
jgi:multimeric flavodoxin WrbA